MDSKNADVNNEYVQTYTRNEIIILITCLLIELVVPNFCHTNQVSFRHLVEYRVL